MTSMSRLRLVLLPNRKRAQRLTMNIPAMKKLSVGSYIQERLCLLELGKF
jgi:hypothetical protein